MIDWHLTSVNSHHRAPRYRSLPMQAYACRCTVSRMSGFHAFPKTPGTHQADPVKGSWYSERTQHPANLLADFDYPVIAVCGTCQGRIRLRVKMQMEWEHVPEEGK